MENLNAQVSRHSCRRRFNLPDPILHRVNFPVVWSRACNRMFLSPEECALFFARRGKTAERWMDREPVNSPSGDVVDYAWRYAPDIMQAAID